MAGPEGLTHITTPDLVRLFRYVHRGQVSCPLDTVHLALAGFQNVADRLQDSLRGLDQRGVTAVLTAVIAERSAQEAEREGRRIRPIPTRTTEG